MNVINLVEMFKMSNNPNCFITFHYYGKKNEDFFYVNTSGRNLKIEDELLCKIMAPVLKETKKFPYGKAIDVLVTVEDFSFNLNCTNVDVHFMFIIEYKDLGSLLTNREKKEITEKIIYRNETVMNNHKRI